MNADVLVAVLVAVLSSSALVALINWLKDRKTTAAQAESLSTASLREALTAVRLELKEVRVELHAARDELHETKKALDEALVQLEKYRRLLVEKGHI